MDNTTLWKNRKFSKKQIEVLKKNNFKNISPDKQKLISKKGGIASGIARRNNKAINELVNVIIDNLIPNETYRNGNNASKEKT